MLRIRYWLWCLRYGKELTYEQWEVLHFMHTAYERTIGAALKKL